jgi:hypothetical protein
VRLRVARAAGGETRQDQIVGRDREVFEQTLLAGACLREAAHFRIGHDACRSIDCIELGELAGRASPRQQLWLAAQHRGHEGGEEARAVVAEIHDPCALGQARGQGRGLS